MILGGCFACEISFAQSSVLKEGKWARIAVSETGVYKITFDQLKKLGLNPGLVNPRKIRIFGNEGGMLPQLNTAPRPDDLIENAIYIEGEGDGKFNSSDYILFFAQGPDKFRYNKTRRIFAYESNLYSDENFYFINVGTTDGLRVTTVANPGGNLPALNYYPDFVHREVDATSILASGREWFGERFGDGGENTFDLDISGIPDNAQIRFVSDVMAQAYGANASFEISINGTPIVTQQVAKFNESEYGLKGVHRRDTVSLTGAAIGASGKDRQTIRYRYTKPGTGAGYLDFFLFSYERYLSRYGDQTLFNNGMQSTASATLNIDNANGCVIWNVTDPYHPAQQQFEVNQTIGSFAVTTDAVQSFIIFKDKFKTPTLIGGISNQDLHGSATPDFVIVSHPDFVQQAIRLGSHRQSQRGWTFIVVTPEQIYNEFSSGRQDVTAIRDFIKHLYDKSPGKLKAALMFGRGSYDYKDRVRGNTNFVPIYESRNSLSPLETYSSDDYYGFLEDGKGTWNEFPAENTSLDIGIGRFTVKTVEEATAVVDKIIAYDQGKKRFGTWRKDIVFVADDGNNTDKFSVDHQSDADFLAEQIESLHPYFNTRKMFIGTYPKIVKPNSESIPQFNENIQREFERGALIMNYTGHGSERVWADERIFTNEDIEQLDNSLYPFLVTATCEFGRHDNPADISSAELSLIRNKAGSIGLVTTTRPVYSITNFYLNQAFYETLFDRVSGEYQTLGEIFKHTKNNSISGVGNRNFSLLADPSMTLAMPGNAVEVTAINTTNGSDTLRALSTVVVTGYIKDEDGTVMNDFNGTLEAILFDKKTDFVTIGKNNPPFQFQQWYNGLYRGKASVRDGQFELRFMMPKNIAYQIGEGKLSLYAYDAHQNIDASGVSENFKVGGSESNVPADDAAPEIQLFMADTTFVSGGVVLPNTNLLVRLTDDSGINTSNYGIGNNMIAVLDGEQTFALGEYYMADADTYKKGWVNFPLKNLSPGKHYIVVKAWDTHNNPAAATIEFTVSDVETLVIETFANYPNPFANETTLFFHHNRSGDDLSAELFIYDIAGVQVSAFKFDIPSSPYQVNLLELDASHDLGKKLSGGVYFARLSVRSLTNGSKNERVAKLIILN